MGRPAVFGAADASERASEMFLRTGAFFSSILSEFLKNLVALQDLIHTLAYVGMFVAAIISVGACKSGIWVAAILAWIVAGIIIGLAIISDYKKAELLKNGTRIIGKVTATKRVHIKFHMSTYHLADEDVIYPYVVHYQYKVKGETYNGKSQWFWFNPCIPKGAPIKILVDPKNPARSTVLKPES